MSFPIELESEMAQLAGQVLLNSLWQAGLVFVVLQVCLKMVKATQPQLRYLISLGASGLILTCSLFTWSWLDLKENEEPVAAVHPVNSDSHVSLMSSLEQPGNASPDNMEFSDTSEGRENKPAMVGSKPSLRWAQILFWGWLTGVALMLVRFVRQLTSTASIRVQSRENNDTVLQGIVNRLVQSMRIAESIPVRISMLIQSPVVIGIIKPVILFPAAMATRLSQDQLEAILAHELAHIRRHDFLINIIQRLIETLYYFNPFVWLIHQQIRIEREACCDSMAVSLIGQKESYAEALIKVSEWMTDSQTPMNQAVAFADQGKTSGVIDRFKRLLIPGYQPRLGLRAPGIFVTLLVTGLALTLLHKGSNEAAEFAQRILSDRERIDIIQAELTRNPIPQYGKEEGEEQRISITGRITLEDGTVPDLLKSVHLNSNSKSAFSHVSASESISDEGHFIINRSFETITIGIVSTNYAPVFVGPFSSRQARELDPLNIVLKQGFEGKIQLQDPAGNPVPKASVKYLYNSGLSSISFNYGSHTLEKEQGVICIPNVSDSVMFDLTLEAPGYEKQKLTGIRFHEGEPFRVKMKPTPPLTIKVISAMTDQPIPNATLHLLSDQKHGKSNSASLSWGPEQAPVVATSNAGGEFQLDTLSATRNYFYLLRAENFQPTYLRNVRIGEEPRTVSMEAPMIIRGRIIGSLDHLNVHGKNKTPYVYCSYGWNFGNTGNSDMLKVNVEPTAQGGTFEIKRVPPGKIKLTVGDRVRRLNVSKPLEEVVFDFDKPKEVFPTRTVNITFNRPRPDSPDPEGFLNVRPLKHLPQNHYLMPEQIKIESGTASVEVEVPGKLMIEPYGLIGYFMKLPRNGNFDIPEGESALDLKLDVEPAGGIACEVTGPTPKVLGDTRIRILPEDNYREKVPGFDYGDFNDFFGNREVNRITLTPLPLDIEYRIIYSNNYYYGITDPIVLTQEKPLANKLIRIGEGIPVRGRVVLPDGSPAVEFTVHMSYLPDTSHSFGWIDVYTDSEGRFEFPNVNPDAEGRYSLSIEPSEKYVPIQQTFRHPWPELNFQLNPGKTGRGRILDAATGDPVPGLNLRAIDFKTGLRAETQTNGQGLFEFSTLGDREYTLYADQANWAEVESPIIRGGHQGQRILMVNIPEWSRHHPDKK